MPPIGNGHSDRVAQASAMVSAQAHCTTAAAIVIMRQLAADTDTTLEEIANLVVAGEIRFDD